MIALVFWLCYFAIAIRLVPALSRKVLHLVCDPYPADDTDRFMAFLFGTMAAALWPVCVVLMFGYGFVWGEKEVEK